MDTQAPMSKLKLPTFLYSLSNKCTRNVLSRMGAATVGVRALVVQENQVLLVKHTYTPGWYLPGGGIQSNESPLDAIKRELKEETGIVAIREPELFGVYHHQIRGSDDYPILYIVKGYTQQEKTPCNEISDMSWFDYTELPHDTTRATRERISEYFFQVIKANTW